MKRCIFFIGMVSSISLHGMEKKEEINSLIPFDYGDLMPKMVRTMPLTSATMPYLYQATLDVLPSVVSRNSKYGTFSAGRQLSRDAVKPAACMEYYLAHHGLTSLDNQSNDIFLKYIHEFQNKNPDMYHWFAMGIMNDVLFLERNGNQPIFSVGHQEQFFKQDAVMIPIVDEEFQNSQTTFSCVPSGAEFIKFMYKLINKKSLQQSYFLQRSKKFVVFLLGCVAMQTGAFIASLIMPHR